MIEARVEEVLRGAFELVIGQLRESISTVQAGVDTQIVGSLNIGGWKHRICNFIPQLAMH